MSDKWFGIFSSQTEPNESWERIRTELANGNAVLVDVREPDEWNLQHVDGAISVPLSVIKAQAHSPGSLDSVLNRNQYLFVHCVKGIRSKTAIELLTKAGFRGESLSQGVGELIGANLFTRPS